jgi:hypothetical protein
VISPGSTSVDGNLIGLLDGLPESAESILVTIASVTNAIVFGNQQATIALDDHDVDPNFIVTELAPTESGFLAEFSNGLDTSRLNLYDTQSSGLGPADVLLVGQTVGPVTGSLVVKSGTGRASFIKSGLPLAPDTYTVTLRSAADGFTTAGGTLLDGNENQVAGTDYVAEFTVSEPAANAVAIGAPDFVRGPGQEIHLPADTTTGIPLSITDGENIQSIAIRLRYDPALLEITGATISENIPAGATLEFDRAVPGLVLLEFSSSSPLTPGSQTFVNLQAFVPVGAADRYGTQQVLDLHEATIRDVDGNVVPVVVDDALHVVSYFGDSSGNRRINASDAARLAQVAALLDSGLAAFPSTDPTVVGDISSNGRLNAGDASLVARFAALFEIPEIPAVPAGAAALGQNYTEATSTTLDAAFEQHGKIKRVPLLPDDTEGEALSLGFVNKVADVAKGARVQLDGPAADSLFAALSDERTLDEEITF